jgi:Family of unknown function (DUF6868)
MNESGDLKNRLEITAKILLRCFILNFALILFWFFVFLIGNGQWGYGIHSKIFDITRHEFELINYCGMAFVKLCNIIFFLFPYVAIRLVLKYNFSQIGN